MKAERYRRQRQIFCRIGRQWYLFAGGALCSLGIALITAYVGLLSRRFLEISAGGQNMPSAGREIAIIAIILVAVHLPKGLLSFGQNYLIAGAVNRLARDLRNEIYEHLQKLSLSFFERNRTGSLMSRMINDVALIQNSSGSVVDAISAPITIVVLVGIMFYIQWQLAIVMIIFAPLMGFAIDKIGKRLRRLTAALQLKVADVTTVIEETITGVRVVRSFGMEKHEIARFRDHNQQSYRAAMRAVRRNAAISPTVEIIGMIGVGGMLAYGGWLIGQGWLTLPLLGQFGFYAFFVSSSARHLGRLNASYQQTMAGADRIFEIMDEQPEVTDAKDAQHLEQCTGRVEFQDVSFSYQHGEEVLRDIYFTIEPGQCVAVVGPSGAGKSTIANLLPRFYDVTGGSVLIDGKDVRDLTAASLRKHIAIVPQETMLFGGTVRENIAYGDPAACEERIEEAAKAAFAHDFILKLESGYDTVIGERGARLSGGERQRIAIARALLKDPRILILDEATSSLDSTSEAVVQSALEVLMKGRSTLIIAHRLSTITKADKIIVMQGGRIAECGAFAELMAMEGVFAGLHRLQFRSNNDVEMTDHQ